MPQKKLIEDDPTFQRQRRLLLIISLVLVFYVLTGVEISEISALGNTVELQSQRGVGVFLWVLWGYWFLRYWHSFREQDLSNFSGVYKKKRTWFRRRYALWRARRDKDLLKEVQLEHSALSNPKVILSALNESEEGTKFPGVPWIEAHVTFYCEGGETEASLSRSTPRYLINPPANFAVNVFASVMTAIDSRFLAEFFLPFVVAFAPLVACAFKNWTSLI